MTYLNPKKRRKQPVANTEDSPKEFSRVVSLGASLLDSGTNDHWSGGQNLGVVGNGIVGTTRPGGSGAAPNMASFEEWIKLATDNKINTSNSWNVALIDYFHDLRVLRDGDGGVNFQKASATLDGCVKIYSSRVDSVATATGKLLTGLGAGAAEVENEAQTAGDAGDDEVSNAPRKASRRNVSNTNTLVEFDTIRLKSFEKELAIDPLFKKALAEFDEGGAKSLLLNTLGVDETGRVVFDAAAATAGDGAPPLQKQESAAPLIKQETAAPLVKQESAAPLPKPETVPVDLASLRSFLYATPSDLADIAICSQLKALEQAAEDPSLVKVLLEEMAAPGAADFDLGFDLDLAPGGSGYTLGADYDMGDAAASTPASEQLYNDDADFPESFPGSFHESNHSGGFSGGLSEGFGGLSEGFGADLEGAEGGSGPGVRIIDHDLMAYFDQRLKHNWRGPEHWRVAAVKRGAGAGAALGPALGPALGAPPQRKEKLVIDFLTPDTSTAIFEPPRLKHLIVLSKKEQAEMTKDAWVLPVDTHFSSVRLTKLGLKEDVDVTVRAARGGAVVALAKGGGAVDERRLAAAYAEAEAMTNDPEPEPEPVEADDDMEQDFDMGQVFEDPVKEGPTKGNELRYERVAKKVDIKRLKDNIWKVVKATEVVGTEEAGAALVTLFSSVVSKISPFYAPEARKELSTSFCFICVLHLANEHGLTIASDESLTDLAIHLTEALT